MTQTDTAPSSPPSKCADRKKCWLWGLLIIFILAGAGSVALKQCPFLYPPPSLPHIAALEKRIEILESHTNQSAPDSGLTNKIDALQNQIAQLQNQTNQQISSRKIISETLAFLDMRDAARQGKSFTESLAALRVACGDDASLGEPLAKLEPYATDVPPTLAQLRETLATQEAAITPEPEFNPNFLDRLKTIFRPLISVRPLHDAHYAALESALDSGDAQAALTAFTALPETAQKNLATWQSKLQARAALEEALRHLTTALTIPGQEQQP